jgi:ABC-type antimicrobial peptide transport system permease subunit
MPFFLFTSTSPAELISYDLVPMDEEIDRSESAYLHRSASGFVSRLALFTIVLSLIGLYGWVTYSVSQRTREIGIRMALGAQRKAVFELFSKEFIWLITLETGLGFVCSFGVSKYMRGLLFGITAFDSSTIALVAAQ